MKQAMSSSLEHNEVSYSIVCKAVGISKPQLKAWLVSRLPSVQWDARIADWMKRAQGRALESQQWKEPRP
eukprot:CAMPEP_0119392684 /NCGR_PEP_ID=MMETSP1334-20130426/122123_1 /TAXON_ID=127549 /ORGANISM="Calcidiscus leptoporus, Strain RCC1130" /LENGTH=69 /DNA_ID=CAMNT_0007415575 /DNA_START=1 /DNA_END=207 /DNA_ORIENTATION=+